WPAGGPRRVRCTQSRRGLSRYPQGFGVRGGHFGPRRGEFLGGERTVFRLPLRDQLLTDTPAKLPFGGVGQEPRQGYAVLACSRSESVDEFLGQGHGDLPGCHTTTILRYGPPWVKASGGMPRPAACPLMGRQVVFATVPEGLPSGG